MSANDEKYLDSLLDSVQDTDNQSESLDERFPDRDIIAQLSRDKEREWEESGKKVNPIEKMSTEDVVSTSLENLLAKENPVEEPKAEPEESQDGDGMRQMSQEEIEAMFNATSVNAQPEQEEPAVAETPEDTIEPEPAANTAEEPEQSADGMNQMSQEEIEAMFNAANGSAEPEPEEPAVAETPEENAEPEPAMDTTEVEPSVEESAAPEPEPATNTVEEPEQDADSMKQMSQDEIEALIKAASAAPEEKPEEKPEEQELDDDIFASLMADDPENDEIAGIREKSEEPAESSESEENQEEDSGKKKKKKAKKEKKAKKRPEETGMEEGERPKKKGFFQKLLDLLTEEDFDEESPENTNLGENNASAENAAILESLDNKPAVDAKAEKKAAKEKAKQEKKAEKEQKKKEKEKAAQEKKAAKPKKEKPPKEEKGENRNRKVFPKKLILMVAILALTVFGGICLVTSQAPKLKALGDARKAFYNHDYKEAYEGFYGYDLKEKDQVLYNQAYSILKMQQRLDAYESYKSLGMELEALDALIEGVAQYEELYAYGQTNGASDEISTRYQEILNTLMDVYGISEEDAITIAQEDDDLCYTLRLEAVLGGYDYVDPYENLDYYLEKIGKEEEYQSNAPADDNPTSHLEDNTLPEEQLLQEQLTEDADLEQQSTGETTAAETDSSDVTEENSGDTSSTLTEEQYVTE